MRFVGDIGFDEPRRVAEPRSDRATRLDLYIAGDDTRTLLDESDRGGLADTAGRTGDDGNLAFES